MDHIAAREIDYRHYNEYLTRYSMAIVADNKIIRAAPAAVRPAYPADQSPPGNVVRRKLLRFAILYSNVEIRLKYFFTFCPYALDGSSNARAFPLLQHTATRVTSVLNQRPSTYPVAAHIHRVITSHRL